MTFKGLVDNRLSNAKKNTSFDAVALIRENVVAFAVGTGVLILATLIGAVYAFQKQQGEMKASQLLLHAKSPAQQEAILNQYPSSTAAPAAMLALASGAFHAGALDQALGHYVRFLEKYPEHPMALTAELGALMCHEGRGQTALALDGFSKFAAVHSTHFLVPQALFGKARCLYTLGREAEARSVYEDYISTHVADAWTPIAESALSHMEMEERAKTGGKR